MVCQGLGITAEEVEGMGDVQPALIDAEGLHQVRVLLVDGVDLFGDLPVQFVVGWQQHQLRALFLGLPDGFRRLDAEFFRRFILGQDDAVPFCTLSGHGGGNVAQVLLFAQNPHAVGRRPRQERAVHIHMKDHPGHPYTTRKSVQRCVRTV